MGCENPCELGQLCYPKLNMVPVPCPRPPEGSQQLSPIDGQQHDFALTITGQGVLDQRRGLGRIHRRRVANSHRR